MAVWLFFECLVAARVLGVDILWVLGCRSEGRFGRAVGSVERLAWLEVAVLAEVTLGVVADQ